MQYYNFARHVNYVICGKKIVMLDARHDRYIFLDKEKTEWLLMGMQGEVEHGASKETRYPLQEAIKRNLVVAVPCMPVFSYYAEPLNGVDNHEWTISERTNGKNINADKIIIILSAFIFVKIMIKFGRLDLLFRLLKVRPKDNKLISIAQEKVVEMAKQVRLASLLLPFKTACLESAIVTAFILRKSQAPVKFLIGVQLNPFMAHAWVEYKGEVIVDKSELNVAMMKIVEI